MSEPDAEVQTLGGYRLLEKIARGGMGEVWRGERVSAGGVRRRVAIKRILPEYQREPMLRDRFIAEARITARLEHPNIVQLIDFGDAPDLFLVLEYVEGISLADIMRRALQAKQPMPVAAALYVIAEAATGLDYAHRRKDDQGQPLEIVHRDVSPPNILVSIDGSVKVNDFGIARAADNIFRTQAGLAVGKLVYMSPEQARGERVDRRADVWALGVVLWESLTLRPLFPRDNPGAALEAQQRGDVVAPSRFMPAVPPAVDEIVLAALRVDREQRTASAGRLASSIRSVLHTLAPGFDSRDVARWLANLAPDLALRSSGDPMTPAFAGPSARASAPPHTPELPPGPIAVAPTPVAGPGHFGAIAHAQAPNQAPPPNFAAPPVQTVHPATIVAAPPAGMLAGPPPAAARAQVAPVPLADRRWLWRLVAIVAIVAGVLGAAAYFLFVRAGSVDDAANAAADPTSAPRAAIASTVAQVARQCADQLSLSGARVGSGMLVVDASFLPSGYANAVSVRVSNTPRDAEMVQCVEQALRSTTIPASGTGASVTQLNVTF